jgi:hypothetical protein
MARDEEKLTGREKNKECRENGGLKHESRFAVGE